MNPYTRYHNSGSGIVCEFDDCPRLFLACHISASEEVENLLSFLTCREEGMCRRSRCFCRPYPVRSVGCRVVTGQRD